MLVHESVLSYISDTSTTYKAWEGCDSVEDYSNKITMTSLKVRRTGLNSDDEVIASPMLAGLPNE